MIDRRYGSRFRIRHLGIVVEVFIQQVVSRAAVIVVIEGSLLVRDVIGFYLAGVAGFFLIQEEGGGLRFILNPTSRR